MRVFRVVAACMVFNATLAVTARADHISGLDGLRYIWQDTEVNMRTDGSYVVGYANKTDYHDRTNGVSVALTLTENANVQSAAAYNSSVIDCSGIVWGAGGQGGLGAFDNASVNMSGDFAAFMLANQNGTINFTGGRTNFATFYGTSTGNISNAVIGDPNAPTGGTELEARESSNVTVSGTRIVEEMRALHGSRITALDITVGLDVIGRDAAHIELTGGNLGKDLLASEFASIAGSGITTVGHVIAESGSITLESSSVGGSVRSGSAGSIALTNVTIAGDLRPGGPARMTGGVVNGSVNQGGFDVLSINGGQVVGSVTATGGGPVSLGGGATVGGNVSLWNGSIDNARIAGNLTNAGSPNTAKITIAGGQIDGDLLANGRGAILLSSGAVAGNVIASSHVEMSGGTVAGDFSSTNSATIKGGDVLGQLAIRSSFVRMEGGRIGQNVNAAADAQFYFLGGAVDGKADIGPGGLLFMADGALAGDTNLGSGAQGNFFGGTVAGNANAPSGAFVTIDERGNIAGDLVLGDTSFAVMRNGTVGGSVSAAGSDQTTFDMRGGTVRRDVALAGSAQAFISGGAIAGDILAGDATSAGMAGGQALRLLISGAARALVEDGILERINAGDGSVITITGGQVNEFVRGAESAVVTVSGSASIYEALGRGSSRFTVKGGSIYGGVLVADTSSMMVEGGNVGTLNVTDNASLLIDNRPSGSIVRTSDISASGSSRVTVAGPSNLFITRLGVRDSGVVVLNGGDIENGVTAAGNSTVNMSVGAAVGAIDLFDGSALTLTGGTVRGNVVAHGANLLVINGGQMDLLRGESDSELVFGGTAVAKKIQVAGSGSVFINNGTIATDVVAAERATLSFGGGAGADGNVIADDDARLDVLGGIVRKDLIAQGFSTVHVGGGTIVGRALVSESANLHWSGGTINGAAPPAPAASRAAAFRILAAPLTPEVAPRVGVFAHGASTVNVYGTDLEAVLSDADYLGVYSLYHLTGTFADGTAIGDDAYFTLENGTGASYRLLPPSAIPEPGGALLLLALALSCVVTRPRRSAAGAVLVPSPVVPHSPGAAPASRGGRSRTMRKRSHASATRDGNRLRPVSRD